MLTLLLVVFWFACGFISYGISFAYWSNYKVFPGQASQTPEELRDTQGFCALGVLFGPLGLVVVFCLSGFAQHGMRFKK